MTRTDLMIPHSFARPGTDNLTVSCTVFEDENTTVLFVEAPNWANAVQWGPSLALTAWNVFKDYPTRLNCWNPSDTDNFFIYRIRPGFPADASNLWTESFSHYEPRQRAATVVERLIPVPGTYRTSVGRSDSLEALFKKHVVVSQTLQMYDSTGNLR
jgi:hypothetical protein